MLVCICLDFDFWLEQKKNIIILIDASLRLTRFQLLTWIETFFIGTRFCLTRFQLLTWNVIFIITVLFWMFEFKTKIVKNIF